MKNPKFGYARPTTLDEALDLLASSEDAKLLAGGQSLLPVLALRLGSPDLVVDIGRVPGLDEITLAADGSVAIGALVRHAEVEDSHTVAGYAPLVAAAMPWIGHRAIRNQGTTVGSIAHGDPAAEMPAVCLSTSAVMTAVSARGERSIPAADFFDGFLTTALEPDEILTKVTFPPWRTGDRGAVVEQARRHGDYALVGLSARVHVTDGVIDEAVLAFLSVASTPVRVAAAEESLIGSAPSTDAYALAAEVVSNNLTPGADVHATANYRKHLAGVLTKRALEQALMSEVAA